MSGSSHHPPRLSLSTLGLRHTQSKRTPLAPLPISTETADVYRLISGTCSLEPSHHTAAVSVLVRVGLLDILQCASYTGKDCARLVRRLRPIQLHPSKVCRPFAWPCNSRYSSTGTTAGLMPRQSLQSQIELLLQSGRCLQLHPQPRPAKAHLPAQMS